MKSHFFDDPEPCVHDWYDTGEIIDGVPTDKKNKDAKPFLVRIFRCAACNKRGGGVLHGDRWEISEEVAA